MSTPLKIKDLEIQEFMVKLYYGKENPNERPIGLLRAIQKTALHPIDGLVCGANRNDPFIEIESVRLFQDVPYPSQKASNVPILRFLLNFWLNQTLDHKSVSQLPIHMWCHEKDLQLMQALKYSGFHLVEAAGSYELEERRAGDLFFPPERESDWQILMRELPGKSSEPATRNWIFSAENDHMEITMSGNWFASASGNVATILEWAIDAKVSGEVALHDTNSVAADFLYCDLFGTRVWRTHIKFDSWPVRTFNKPAKKFFDQIFRLIPRIGTRPEHALMYRASSLPPSLIDGTQFRARLHNILTLVSEDVGDQSIKLEGFVDKVASVHNGLIYQDRAVFLLDLSRFQSIVQSHSRPLVHKLMSHFLQTASNMAQPRRPIICYVDLVSDWPEIYFLREAGFRFAPAFHNISFSAKNAVDFDERDIVEDFKGDFVQQSHGLWICEKTLETGSKIAATGYSQVLGARTNLVLTSIAATLPKPRQDMYMSGYDEYSLVASFFHNATHVNGQVRRLTPSPDLLVDTSAPLVFQCVAAHLNFRSQNGLLLQNRAAVMYHPSFGPPPA